MPICDAQQLSAVRRMVRDLNIPVEIVPGPTVREPDGLALSSRNQYLSPKDRSRALLLSKALGTVDLRKTKAKLPIRGHINFGIQLDGFLSHGAGV